MANKKISELPGASTADAADLVPIVQGGETKNASITKVLATHADSDGSSHAKVNEAITHKNSAGGDHSRLGQDVSPTASPSFTALQLINLINEFSTDGTLAGDSDDAVPTEKAVKAYADALLAVNDALVYKGAVDCSTNPDYPAADAGHRYVVSVAGKIGGASGVDVAVNDTFTCYVDSTAGGDQATVGANWNVITGAAPGSVIGPVSSADEAIAIFDGITGKLLKSGTGTLSAAGLLAGVTNTNWDAAYAHVSADGKSHADVLLNNAHRVLTNNPHSVTQTQVGLSDVDNTSDEAKPVSTAQQAALDDKVTKTGAETVAGTKTFTSFPVTPSSAPTSDYQVANKKYVDDNGGGGGGVTTAQYEALLTQVGVLTLKDVVNDGLTGPLGLLTSEGDMLEDKSNINEVITTAIYDVDGDYYELNGADASAEGSIELTSSDYPNVSSISIDGSNGLDEHVYGGFDYTLYDGIDDLYSSTSSTLRPSTAYMVAFEFWASGDIGGLTSSASSGSVTDGFTCYLNTTDIRWYTAGPVIATVPWTAGTDQGQWHTIVARQGASLIDFFKNGVKGTGGANTLSQGLGPLKIGTGEGGGFVGNRIRNYAIFLGTATDTQIQNYTAGDRTLGSATLEFFSRDGSGLDDSSSNDLGSTFSATSAPVGTDRTYLLPNLVTAFNAGSLSGDWTASTVSTTDDGVLILTADNTGTAYNDLPIAGVGGDVTFSNETDTAGGSTAVVDGELFSKPFTAQAAPGTLRIIALIEWLEAGTINTDITVEADRFNDTSTGLETVTMEYQGDFNATQEIYTGVLDVSGQTSGTQPLFRIAGANAKNARVHGFYFQWDV